MRAVVKAFAEALASGFGDEAGRALGEWFKRRVLKIEPDETSEAEES